MNWEAPLAAAIAPLVAFVLGAVSQATRTARWSGLRQKVELLNMLPVGEDSRALREHIHKTLVRMVRDEEEFRRSPAGVALATLLLAISGWAAYEAARTGGNANWWFLSIPMFMLGATGLSQDAIRRPRDARGRPLKGDDT